MADFTPISTSITNTTQAFDSLDFKVFKIDTTLKDIFDNIKEVRDEAVETIETDIKSAKLVLTEFKDNSLEELTKNKISGLEEITTLYEDSEREFNSLYFKNVGDFNIISSKKVQNYTKLAEQKENDFDDLVILRTNQIKDFTVTKLTELTTIASNATKSVTEAKEDAIDTISTIRDDAEKYFKNEADRVLEEVKSQIANVTKEVLDARDEVVGAKSYLAEIFDSLKISVDNASNFGIYRILPNNIHYIALNMPNERISSYIIPYFEIITGKKFNEVVEYCWQFNKYTNEYINFVPGLSKVGSTDDFFFNIEDKETGIVETVPFTIQTKPGFEKFMFKWNALNVQGSIPTNPYEGE
jgi:vacuolar-type H+-ATPase subunit E/Vma4